MNSSPDNQDPIRKLLIIKKYEQPPPGFFNSFSHQVIARIQTESRIARQPWWQQWFAEISGQPLLASTYALLFAGLFVVALGLAQSPTEDEQAGASEAMFESAYSSRQASVGSFPVGQFLQQHQVTRSSLDPAAPLAIPGSGLEKMLFEISSNAMAPVSYQP
jgi:hypothetical protein